MLSKLSFSLSLAVAFLCSTAAVAQTAPAGAAKLLPERLGDFRAQGPAVTPPNFYDGVRREDYGVRYNGRRTYVSPSGEVFNVSVVRTDSESGAYSFFTLLNSSARRDVKLGDIGTASILTPSGVDFVKGSTFVSVGHPQGHEVALEPYIDFARQFAATLEGGENGLPVLVSHLPEWEKTYDRAAYAVTLPALQTAAGRRPVLDAVALEGGAEAVAANYGEALLVVVEFTTPQHAFDADAAVNRRVAELKAAGQPVPSAYKRVGNYAVFVFDAPDAAAAEKLAAGVKWEKDVRWLGRNPHADEIAIRAYTSTMGGVILTTLITTGVAILVCLGVGGLIGGAVFLHRRARQAEQEVYTDAGGMVRLNIEDLNTPPPPSKLLKPAED
ncbi:MAG: DUF6599 family protein [Pyrinomonadaceae bacterium]